MYIVKNSQGETVAVCTRKEDAQALAGTKLDGTEYKITVDNTNS